MDTDRDILIEVKTKVEEIHRQVTQPGGRVPNLEKTVASHETQINRWWGAVAVLVGLFTVLGGAFVVHVLGGK